MPKKKLPYYDRKGYVYIYVNRQPVSLKAPNGRRCKTGTPEALCAYHRFSLGIDNSPAPNEHNVTITELSAGYLTHLKTKQHVNYDTVKTVVDDFLLALYGDGYGVDYGFSRVSRPYSLAERVFHFLKYAKRFADIGLFFGKEF